MNRALEGAERTVGRSLRDAREDLTALEDDTTIQPRNWWPNREEIVVGQADLADKVDVRLVGNDAAVVAHLEDLLDGFAAVVAVVERALIDVHADKAVG